MRWSNLSGRLLVIVSAAILPLAVVCAFALQALLAGQSAQSQASALGVARAVVGLLLRRQVDSARGLRAAMRGAGMVRGAWGLHHTEYARRTGAAA